MLDELTAAAGLFATNYCTSHEVALVSFELLLNTSNQNWGNLFLAISCCSMLRVRYITLLGHRSRLRAVGYDRTANFFFCFHREDLENVNREGKFPNFTIDSDSTSRKYWFSCIYCKFKQTTAKMADFLQTIIQFEKDHWVALLVGFLVVLFYW